VTDSTSTSSPADPAPGIGRLSGIVLDCPDPLGLAAFYSRLTGWPVHDSSDASWALIVTPYPGDVALAFQQVADYVAPVWPTTEQPQQFHLDLDVDDLDAGEAAVLALGAVRHAYQPGEQFRVFLDPAGHPFCLCVDD